MVIWNQTQNISQVFPYCIGGYCALIFGGGIDRDMTRGRKSHVLSILKKRNLLFIYLKVLNEILNVTIKPVHFECGLKNLEFIDF